MIHAQHILLICGDQKEMDHLTNLLTTQFPREVHITKAEQIHNLSAAYFKNDFHAAILDTSLLGNGYSTYEWIRKIQSWKRELPIIVLFEKENERDVLRALSNGVQDYLIKQQYSSEVLNRAIHYAIQRKRYEEKIAYLTMQDHLTGLMNSELLSPSLRQAIFSAKRERSLLAIYYVDVDNFKEANELHGHDVGNALLIDIASRLQTVLDENSILARLSADRFVVIDIAEDLDACAVLAEEIISSMQVTTIIAGLKLQISTSIGVATYPECGNTHTELMKHAEMALSQAKQSGGGSYRFFSKELNEEATRRIHITSALKMMADDDMFQLYYQPKIDLTSMQVTGVEALIRWTHPVYGNIPPDHFIPLAEEAGLIHNVSNWVARNACEQYQHPIFKDLEMCINVSANEMSDYDIVDMIRHILLESQVPADKLILEVTETAVLTDKQRALKVMHKLKDLGVKLYLDDFGTGYSSIDYLRRYPVDALKIDRNFIMHIHEQEEDIRLVRLIIDIAQELNLRVIAEGIEHKRHVEILKSIDCTEGQGYYFSRPLPAPELITWLQETEFNTRM